MQIKIEENVKSDPEGTRRTPVITSLSDIAKREGKSTLVMVVGTPRSGTSCVAGAMHYMGIPMGTQFTEPDSDNPAGYFEDRRFADYHASVTDTADFPNMMEVITNCVEKGLYFSALSPQFNPAIYLPMSIIAMLSAQNPVWGFKDPRLILPYLIRDIRVVCGNMTETKVVFVARDNYSSANSLWAITGLKERYPNLIHNLSQIERTFLLGVNWLNMPYLMISYEQLIFNPEEELTRLANFCGVELTEEAVNFIDPSLRRY